jgi:hypothetical protein
MAGVLCALKRIATTIRWYRVNVKIELRQASKVFCCDMHAINNLLDDALAI